MADVICAAYFASECAIRLARPGKTNTDITNAIRRVRRSLSRSALVLMLVGGRYLPRSARGGRALASDETVRH